MRIPNNIDATLTIKGDSLILRDVLHRASANDEWVQIEHKSEDSIRLYFWWIREYAVSVSQDEFEKEGAKDLRKFDLEDEFDVRSAFTMAVNRVLARAVEAGIVEPLTPLDDRVKVV